MPTTKFYGNPTGVSTAAENIEIIKSLGYKFLEFCPMNNQVILFEHPFLFKDNDYDNDDNGDYPKDFSARNKIKYLFESLSEIFYSDFIVTDQGGSCTPWFVYQGGHDKYFGRSGLEKFGPPFIGKVFLFRTGWSGVLKPMFLFEEDYLLYQVILATFPKKKHPVKCFNRRLDRFVWRIFRLKHFKKM